MRVIGPEGELVGILALPEALVKAEQMGLDLVEIAPTAEPPVCKIVDFGKYRYQLTKKEKEQKKSQHQVKVKEIKLKPNTDDHDLDVKMKHARDFIVKGNKVKLTCTFRGREMQHPEYGRRVMDRVCQGLSDIATPESFPKLMGRSMSLVLAPGVKKKTVNG